MRKRGAERRREANKKKQAPQLVKTSDVQLEWPEPATHLNEYYQCRRISLLPNKDLTNLLCSKRVQRIFNETLEGRARLLGLAKEVLFRRDRGVILSPYAISVALRYLPDPCVVCGRPGLYTNNLKCYCSAHRHNVRAAYTRTMDARQSAREDAIKETERYSKTNDRLRRLHNYTH
jgi:hypothetical protein